MFRKFFLLWAFILAFATPALAAPAINDEGEAALRGQIQRLLDSHKNARTLAGGGLEMDGDILIEQADSYYAVTLPDLTVKEPDGQTMRIGIIAVNAIPMDQEGDWKISLSLPTPITWANEAGQKIGAAHIGEQKFSGVWSDKLNGFSVLNAQYDNLRIEELPTQSTHTIGSIAIKSALKETKDDLWSGNAVVDLRKLGSSSAAHTGTASADALTVTVNIADLSAAKQKQMREKVEAFAENTNPEDLQSMSPAGQLALFNMLMDMVRSAGSAFDMNIAVNNLKTTMPAVAKETAKSIAMKNGKLGFSVAGMDQNSVTLGLRSQYDGLAIAPQSLDSKEMTPTTADVNIKLMNLPFEELVKLGQNSIQNAGKGPAARQFAGIQAMMTLPQILSEAGAQVSIVDSKAASPGYDIALSGAMKADKDATLGGAGTMRAEIAGLDDLLKKLQARMKDASGVEKAKLTKLTQVLSVISLTGQVEKRDGKTVKIYDFELNKDGQMLLNGSDLSLLTGLSASTEDTPKAR